jgi:hypothetical protein
VVDAPFADGDGGNGSMTVRALVRFDREDPALGKVLNIPIIVSDSGTPPQQATRIVQIIIGDEVRTNRWSFWSLAADRFRMTTRCPTVR